MWAVFGPMVTASVIIEERIGLIGFGEDPEYKCLTDYSVDVGHTNSKYLSKNPFLNMITE